MSAEPLPGLPSAEEVEVLSEWHEAYDGGGALRLLDAIADGGGDPIRAAHRKAAEQLRAVALLVRAVGVLGELWPEHETRMFGEYCEQGVLRWQIRVPGPERDPARGSTLLAEGPTRIATLLALGEKGAVR